MQHIREAPSASHAMRISAWNDSGSTDIEDLLAPIKVHRKDMRMTKKVRRKYDNVVSSFATYELQKRTP